MGLGSILGSIAGIGLAPFTGGASMIPTLMGVGGTVGGLADVLGGAAKGSQNQNNESDKIKLLLENAKLNRDKYALSAPGTRLSTGIKASIASNFKPSTLDWGPGGFKPGGVAHGAPLPTRTGGFSGGMANLNPDTKALANQITHDELMSQMQGGSGGGDKAMPTGLGESSTGDKILGGAAMGTSILSVVQRALKGRQSGTTPPYVAPGQSEPWYDTGLG